MYGKFCFLAFLFLSLVFWSCASTSKIAMSGIGEIYGTVTGRDSGEPVAGVNVSLEGYGLHTTTDVDGVYSLRNLAAGSYTVYFSYVGFDNLLIRDLELGGGVHYQLDVLMAKGDLDSLKKKVSVPRRLLHRSYESREAEEADENEPPPPEDFHRESLSKTRIVYRSQQRPLSAAAHNDNEEYPFFLDYLKRYRDISGVYHLNFSDRYIVRFVDEQDRPVFHVPFKIINNRGENLWESVSLANGENVIFPYLMFPASRTDGLTVAVDYSGTRLMQPLNGELDRITTIRISPGNSRRQPALDLLFILDTTGSMGDEIQQLKDNLYSIYTRIHNYFNRVPLRFGLILYRDRGDDYVTRKYDFTGDLQAFQDRLDAIESAGGGDKAEDLQAALQEAVRQMDWSGDAVKISFLLADAPPHLDYKQDFTYPDAALAANRQGIKIYPIGASGLDVPGEYIFRQLAALTYGEFIFLTYGEQGESEGTGPGKVSHHTGTNYQSHNLDDLVVDIVKKELSYQLPAGQVARRAVAPRLQEAYLETRMDNLWAQMVKQVTEFLPGEPVGVLAPIEAADSSLGDLAIFLRQTSTISLLGYPRLKLVERDRLDQVLAEMGLSMAGLLRNENYQPFYNLLNSNIIFLGSLSYAGVERVIFMKGVRTDTGQIVAAARIRL